MYFNDGDRYEGDCIKDNPEGKGIYYFKNGDRFERDFKNGKIEGKGVWYYHSGDRYEGDIKDGKKHNEGVYYYNNGDRSLVEFYDDFPIRKHIRLTKSGEVKEENYAELLVI